MFNNIHLGHPRSSSWFHTFKTSHIQYWTKVPLNASKWLEQLKSNHRETLKGRKLMLPSEELWRNTRRETPVYTEPQGIIENNEQRLSALILKFRLNTNKIMKGKALFSFPLLLCKKMYLLFDGISTQGTFYFAQAMITLKECYIELRAH